MISANKITEIFCFIDEFHIEFEQAQQGHLIEVNRGTKRRNRKSKLSNSEVMSMMVLFHSGNYRNLKHFYLFYVRPYLKSEFPQTVCYTRFVELKQKVGCTDDPVLEDVLPGQVYKYFLYRFYSILIVSYQKGKAA